MSRLLERSRISIAPRPFVAAVVSGRARRLAGSTPPRQELRRFQFLDLELPIRVNQIGEPQDVRRVYHFLPWTREEVVVAQIERATAISDLLHFADQVDVRGGLV